MEHGIFEGRRGQKRLKQIERQLEQVFGEFNTDYENSDEMYFLRKKIQWEGTAELMFAMAMRNVHFTWSGLRDLGFLKLCVKWTEKNGLSVIMPKDAEEMIQSILPETMCSELNEELAALEVF